MAGDERSATPVPQGSDVVEKDVNGSGKGGDGLQIQGRGVNEKMSGVGSERRVDDGTERGVARYGLTELCLAAVCSVRFGHS